MPKNETIPKIYQTRQRMGQYGAYMPKTWSIHALRVGIHALKKVQLSEKVHHWTPDGSYGSRDFKFPINVRMNLSSFDVGFLIATIFGKLKLPPKVDLRSEFKDHKLCILDTQDL